MTDQALYTKQVKGFVPALDPLQLGQPSVVNGQNFLVDAEGPFAAFGSILLSYDSIAEVLGAQTLRVDDKTFLFTDKAIYTYDEVGDFFYPVYEFGGQFLYTNRQPQAGDDPLTEAPEDDAGTMVFSAITVPSVQLIALDVAGEITTQYPWYSARVGIIHYFVKFGGSLISYNPETFVWEEVPIPVSISGRPAAVVEVGGRLILMTEFHVAWSQIDDGYNLTPNSAAGIGFQPLSICGGGAPLGLAEFVDGFIAYTRNGVLKGTRINSLIPFRFDTLSAEVIPINPYCIVSFDQSAHVVLAKNGFYRIAGQAPEIYQPLMGAYFTNKILPFRDLSMNSIIRLTYNSQKLHFYVSVASTDNPYFYEMAWVLYTLKDEWGRFDRLHHGFGELAFSGGIYKGFNFGFLCDRGFIHKFVDFPYVETALNNPYFPLGFYRHVLTEIPAVEVNGVNVFTSYARIYTEDITQYPDLTNWYYVADDGEYNSPLQFLVVSDTPEVDGDVTIFTAVGYPVAQLLERVISVAPKEYMSINSFIEVGPYRLVTQVRADDTNEITHILTNGPEGAGVVESEDWLLMDGEEDWLTSDAPDEDWGDGIFDETNFTVYSIGTLDGKNQYEDEKALMILETSDGNVRYYSGKTRGVAHLIRFEALEENTFFHLKTLDFGAILAGRI